MSNNGGDSFTIEGPVTANALAAATTATIAREAWTDGSVLQFSTVDGKLHPAAIPAGPAPSGAANLLYATPDGSSGAASLRALVGGDIAAGLISNVKLANSSLTVSAGSGLSGGGAVALGGSVNLAVDSATVALLAGAQSFTGQKTFPGAGASAVVLPAVRQSAAGNDITVPAASGADSFALLAQAQTLTNKTISGASNTLSAIGNASLVNSSISITPGTGLAGGGSVSLGGSTALNVPAAYLGDWGDGSDGVATVSTTITLTKTMNYTSLTVQSGGVINTGGFGIYANNSVDVQSGGTIQNNGVAASGSSAGAAAPGVRFGNGANGANGSTTTGGNGSQATLGAGGTGGAGGAGLNGAGGTGGGVGTGVSGDTGGYLTIWSREFGQGVPGNLYRGGGGGAGGGGNNVTAGGGGGGGGGWLVIKAPTINVSGTVQANGGAGANGGGNCGGGGGGGGGVVSLIYLALTGAGTIQAAGGAKGTTGGGSGVNGSDGNAGRVLQRIIG